MAHTIRDQKKLIDRVRRIRGQVAAIERALTEEMDCSVVLHRIAAVRGATNSLMSEVLDGHIRHHIGNANGRPASVQSKAVRELLDVLRTYIK